MTGPRRTGTRTGRPAPAGLVLAFVAVLLAGCGAPAPDPGASRTDAAEQMLRERALNQADR